MFIVVTILAQLLFVSFFILLLFRLKDRFGYAPLYVLLGSNQYFQTVLATSSRIKIFGNLSISAGSSILFSAGLFALLLVYIKEGVRSTQRLILAIVLANFSFTLLSLIINQQELYVNGVSNKLFALNYRVFIGGTLALVLDSFMLVILYEFLFSKAKWLNLYSRLFLAMLITLNFDALLFVTSSFWDHPKYSNILLSQITGKSIVSVFFASFLFLYLRYFDKTGQSDDELVKKGREDIFSILTYKGRYEKLVTDKAIIEGQMQKAINEKALELEESIERFTILSSVKELRIDKYSSIDQAKEFLLKIKEAFKADACTIHQFKNNELTLLTSVGISEDQGKEFPFSSAFVEEIVKKKKPLAIEDTRKDKANQYKNTNTFNYISCLGCPMLSGTKISGILNLYAVNQRRIFSPLEMEHLLLAASQMAQSQENSTLFEQNEKHKEILVKQIVARKKIEEAIKQSNERFELIGKAANDALWEWNLETNQIWGNQAHQQLYGFTLADPVPDDETWKRNLHENDRQRILDSLEETLASDKNIWDGEYWLKTVNKGWINILGRTYIERNEEGIPIRMLGSMMDITERKTQEEVLERSEQNLRQVLTSITDIFYVIDRNYLITLINKTATELLTKAWGTDVIAGKNILEVIPYDTDEHIQKSFEKVFSGESVEYEIPHVSVEKDGWQLVSYHPVISDEGRIIGAYVVTKDISERRNAQEQVIKYNKQLRDLAAHLLNIREEERRRIGREIHDDLGQQLTAIKMDVAWIDKKINNQDGHVKEKLKNIIGLLDGSNQSVRRILNELKPSILDEYGLIDAMEWHANQFIASTSIEVEIQSKEKVIKLDETISTCIFRLFQEALTNVARHSKAKKVITSVTLMQKEIIVSIVDDGIGFDLATAQNKGSFGLMGMKERVRAVEGTIEINSLINNGTTIIIKIPIKNKI